MEFPVYIPNAKVCHMTQYKCCKHRQHCRLYPICSKMDISANKDICKKDCPNCKYEGCSLPEKDRKENPLYVEHVCQQEDQTIDYEILRFREKQRYKKQHKSLYEFYNRLFGDLADKKRIINREWYKSHQDYYKSRRCVLNFDDKPSFERKTHYTPECCDMDCINCRYEDCILPENWLNRARNKAYYYRHREEILQKEKERRSTPKAKAYMAKYNKQYQITHPEATRKKRAKYVEAHREQAYESLRKFRAEQLKLQTILPHKSRMI